MFDATRELKDAMWIRFFLKASIQPIEKRFLEICPIYPRIIPERYGANTMYTIPEILF